LIAKIKYKKLSKEMRVFYIDEDEPSKRYYVKLENMTPPDRLKGYIAIDARSSADLLEQIRDTYSIRNADIELWSNQGRQGLRLDTLTVIPKDHEFIWVRVVARPSE
jgi:hypothetical protein